MSFGDLRLGKRDWDVIHAFLGRYPAASKRLETDGQRLAGLWMGGRNIAVWHGGRIVFEELGGRAAQTVQRAITKTAPRNWLGGFGRAGVRSSRRFGRKWKSWGGFREAAPDLTEIAAAKAAQTREMPHWEPDDGSDPLNWGTFLGHHRDSRLLEESNWEVITNDMLNRFPDDVELVTFGHWGVGWIEEMFVRMRDEQGRFTPAFKAAVKWEEALEAYPVADETDYSEREHEATIENIHSIAYSMVSDAAPEGWESEVYSWLSENGYDNELENVDDQGGYPSEDAVRAALEALGYLEDEE